MLKHWICTIACCLCAAFPSLAASAPAAAPVAAGQASSPAEVEVKPDPQASTVPAMTAAQLALPRLAPPFDIFFAPQSIPAMATVKPDAPDQAVSSQPVSSAPEAAKPVVAAKPEPAKPVAAAKPTPAPKPTAAPKPAPAPKPAAAPKPGTVEDMETARAKLEVFAAQYIQHCNAQVRPSRATPGVSNRDGKMVATYMEFDPSSVQTDLSQAESAQFAYVGRLVYVEHTYEAVGDTKEEAEQGIYQIVRSRRLTELPRYVRGSWVN